MSFMKSDRFILTAIVLSLSTTASVFAQPSSDTAGIVRITDGRLKANVRQTGAQNIEQASQCQGGATGAPCSHGIDSQSMGMQSGSCPTGGCPNGTACRAGYCPTCRGCLHGKFGEHYCKHSPDYGYSPPAKYPLHRRGVEYTNYYPNQWYGAGADYSQSRAPMVYQPTDTTQLGFYYQHVPTWQPMPNMLPERPIPAQWHIAAPAVSASRYCGGCFPGNLGSYRGCQPRGYGYGHGYGFGRRGYDVTDWTPVDQSSSMSQGNCPQDSHNGHDKDEVVPPIQTPNRINQGAPMPVEAEIPSTLPNDGQQGGSAPNEGAAPDRAPSPTNSASSGHIKRIGFRY